jgi:hypothetical protein
MPNQPDDFADLPPLLCGACGKKWTLGGSDYANDNALVCDCVFPCETCGCPAVAPARHAVGCCDHETCRTLYAISSG